MSAPALTPVDRGYLTRRLRLGATVVAHAAQAFAHLHGDQAAAIATIVPVVEAGQQQTASLVDAYMALKAAQATGTAASVIGIDTSRYTISALRNGVPADVVYERAFNSLGSEFGLERSQGALDKIVRTDLQLAQTHAARDAMQQRQVENGQTGIVGYRRLLTGPGPHCALCEAASTRTYKVADLMPIHEHCTCTVTPLFGLDPVEQQGDPIIVDHDPELGPRLMAETWAPVGPRLQFA